MESAGQQQNGNDRRSHNVKIRNLGLMACGLYGIGIFSSVYGHGQYLSEDARC
jgi:hypothetical protein